MWPTTRVAIPNPMDIKKSTKWTKKNPLFNVTNPIERNVVAFKIVIWFMV
jgi:hypothetical protein